MTDQFFVMPDDGMDVLINPLRAARHTIDIYVFTLGNKAILSALGDAVARGVVVRAIAETQPGNNEQAGEANRQALKQIGVQVHQTPRYFNRVHAKSYVVDGALALISTINYLEDWQHTRDYGLLTDNATVIKAVSDTFEADWLEDEQQLRMVPSPPLVLSPNNSRAAISEMITQAARTLVIEQEQISDPDIMETIAARSKAGIDVCVVANPAHDKNLSALAQLSKQAPSARILYATNVWVHAKLIIADDSLMLMGSANLIEVSLEKRREISIFITDQSAIQRAMSTVQQDITAASPTVPDQSNQPERPNDSPGA